MPNLGIWEILIIVLVIVLLFGSKKLPDLARSIGRSTRIFKSEMKEMKNENQQEAPQPQQPESFWDRPENQPRQIEQGQPPIQNPVENPVQNPAQNQQYPPQNQQ